MSSLFQNFLVEPLYNALVFLLNVIPFADLGIAVIILTIVVRVIIFPISKNAIKSQIQMKEITPKIKELQEKYKDDRQKLALETMQLYKDHNVKPFASILMIFIQLPIIFALYFVFFREGLPNINLDILYSFISAPENISANFIFIDLTTKSLILAVAAALTQFFQARILMSRNNGSLATSGNQTEKEKMMSDIMKGMQIQMKYVMPVFMGFIAYSLGGVIALYFTTSNTFSIFQELYLTKKFVEKK